MPEQPKRSRAQGGAVVAGGQKHETARDAKKTRAVSGAVRHAAKKAGNSRKTIGNARYKVEGESKKRRPGAVQA
jgi:hypothetical protein